MRGQSGLIFQGGRAFASCVITSSTKRKIGAIDRLGNVYAFDPRTLLQKSEQPDYRLDIAATAYQIDQFRRFERECDLVDLIKNKNHTRLTDEMLLAATLILKTGG